MDLYVLASYREGFPRSAMEAAATGLPVVATDIRGCRQVVDRGVTGTLVPPRDVAALVDAIAAIAADADGREAMGRAAIAKAGAEFDDRRIVETTLATYDRVPRALDSPRHSTMTVRPASAADLPRVARTPRGADLRGVSHESRHLVPPAALSAHRPIRRCVHPGRARRRHRRRVRGGRGRPLGPVPLVPHSRRCRRGCDGRAQARPRRSLESSRR